MKWDQHGPTMEGMCGRFVRYTPLMELLPRFGVATTRATETPGPRYNIAPSQDVLVVRAEGDGKPGWSFLRWGLVPSWSKDAAIGHRLINARAESVADKPAFRVAFRQRRCLIPADGFYEWAKHADGGRQPNYFYRRDGSPFAFAGLWERWRSPTGTLESCTIITTAANDTLSAVHDRMPVIVAPEDYPLWLAPGQSPPLLQQLLRPAPNDLLRGHAVSPRVNRPSQDGPDLIASV